jgi:hypothetical protein
LPKSAAGWIIFAIGIVFLLGALYYAIVSVINGTIFVIETLLWIIILAIIGILFIWIQQNKVP